MQGKVDKVKLDLDQLRFCAAELAKICEPSVGQSAIQTVNNVEQRWEDVGNALDERVGEFEELLDQWENYDDTCRHTKEWIQHQEKEISHILQEDDGGIATPRHLSAAKVKKTIQIIVNLCI